MTIAISKAVCLQGSAAWIALLLVTSLSFAQAPEQPVATPGPCCSCCSDCSSELDDLPKPRRAWVTAEYLSLVDQERFHSRFLVTTGQPGDPHAGILGQPGTSVIINDSELNFRLNSGGRLTIGWWFDDEQVLGFEAVGFSLETHTIHDSIDSNRTDGAPVIARPFFNVRTGKEDAYIITGPRTPWEGDTWEASISLPTAGSGARRRTF